MNSTHFLVRIIAKYVVTPNWYLVRGIEDACRDVFRGNRLHIVILPYIWDVLILTHIDYIIFQGYFHKRRYVVRNIEFLRVILEIIDACFVDRVYHNAWFIIIPQAYHDDMSHVLQTVKFRLVFRTHQSCIIRGCKRISEGFLYVHRNIIPIISAVENVTICSCFRAIHNTIFHTDTEVVFIRVAFLQTERKPIGLSIVH